jgi:hypothetical protein
MAGVKMEGDPAGGGLFGAPYSGGGLFGVPPPPPGAYGAPSAPSVPPGGWAPGGAPSAPPFPPGGESDLGGPRASPSPPPPPPYDTLDPHKKLLELARALENLKAMPAGDSSDDFCVYDVALADGGNLQANMGQGCIRPCKRHAKAGVNPPLCMQHAQKVLRDRITEGNAHVMKLERRPLSLALSNKVGAFNPKAILVNADEFLDGVRQSRTTDCNGALQTGKVFGRKDAICAAFKALI